MPAASEHLLKIPTPANLALAIALTLGLPTPTLAVDPLSPSPTSTIVVANCNDNGPGSLRTAVANAFDGDTIDLTQLSCSTISLSSGEIVVQRDGLKIKGKGSAATTVTIAYSSGSTGRIFRAFYSDESLTLSGMTVSHGFATTSGGCIAAAGNLTLVDVHVDHCQVRSDAATSLKGGAVSVNQKLVMQASKITGSWVDPHNQQVQTRGCGVYAGVLEMTDSEISNNIGYSKYHAVCKGGGAYVFNQATIQGSTIAGNESFEAAGIWLQADCACASSITNSTFSGNTVNANSFDAPAKSAAIYARGPLTMANTTVTFSNGGTFRGAVYSPYAALTLQSVIISNSSGAGTVADLAGAPFITGSSNNLIVNSQISPPGTLTDSPLLLPLADNGGKTPTHMLRYDSPAIDHGNNSAHLIWDQRGSGFPRVVGATADIGAVEAPLPDRIFRNGFDSQG